ncbi:uncharacterized protein LOC117869428 [Trachemys scripta elegans]|uniref:uncharacterized protein LOC117869428 n=1 Tax=Trachemys scripta elegans TaxID=31138 RepID=UPI0015560BA4|nr:uncharacterized protein LOC117869428 [Trachemys scripta elegans]
MPPPRRPPAHLLLVCLFASFQQWLAALKLRRASQMQPGPRNLPAHGLLGAASAWFRFWLTMWLSSLSPRRGQASITGSPQPSAHAAVLPKIFLLCGISLCSGEHCCDGRCCSLRPGFKEGTTNGFGLIFIIMGVMIGGGVLFTVYKCCKNCAGLDETEGIEPAQPHVPPAPRTAPPRSPSLQPQGDPPPYSEVGSGCLPVEQRAQAVCYTRCQPSTSWCRTDCPRAQPSVPQPGLARLPLALYGSEPISARWPVGA